MFGKIKARTSEERRQISNAKIKKQGIACLEQLPCVEDSSQVQLKSQETICRRAAACLLAIQLACDIAENNDVGESREMCLKLLRDFGVEEELLDKEKRLFDGDFGQQDVIDVAWSYEAYWALVWALGLVRDISAADKICDCKKAITLVGCCSTLEEFRKSCRMRDVEEILDMLDLYYRYHWATTEKRIRPETPIGKLNPDVVMERRKGLEWLISPETDWNDISLDT